MLLFKRRNWPWLSLALPFSSRPLRFGPPIPPIGPARNLETLVKFYRHMHQTRAVAERKKKPRRGSPGASRRGADVTTNFGGYGVVGFWPMVLVRAS